MSPRRSSDDPEIAILRKSYWRADDARVVLHAWRESGATLAAFARRHEVSGSRLARWRSRLKADGAARFHPVRLVERGEPVPAVRAIEVITGGFRVVVPAGFDAAHLRAVLGALETPGC